MAEGDRPMRVLLVEDHQVVREGLRALLSAQPGCEVVGETGEASVASRLAHALRPDVAVVDLALGQEDGVELTRVLRQGPFPPEVVVLSMHDDARTVEAAIGAGARGYVLKGGGIASLVTALRAAMRKESYLSEELGERGIARPGEATTAAVRLSARERDVLGLISEGLTGREVAGRLGLKPKTVENHRQNIMGKLNIHTTAGLVRYALRGDRGFPPR